MSSVQSPRNKPGPKLTNPERTAIVAAVASGQRQCDVAQHFGVTRGTVLNLLKSVRKVNNPANPLQDWRNTIRPTAQTAVENGLTCTRDPYQAMRGGIEVLKGLGVLVNQVEAQVGITVSWIKPDDEPIDVAANPLPVSVSDDTLNH